MPAVLRTCGEVKQFLMDFLDGQLPKVETLRFKGHMMLCAPCKRYMERYNTSVKLSQNILDDPPPQELVNITQQYLKQHQSDD